MALFRKIVLVISCCILVLLWQMNENKIEQYVQKLDSDNMVTLEEAVFYMGEEEFSDEIPKLLKLLISESGNRRVVIETLKALGKMKDKSATDGVISMLDHPDKGVRREAVWCLGMIGDENATLHLLEMLDTGELVLEVISSLGSIGDKRVVPALSRLMDSNDKFVKFNAYQSLRKIGKENK